MPYTFFWDFFHCDWIICTNRVNRICRDVGYTLYNYNKGFAYEIDEDNNIIASGKVKYDEAKCYCLARVYEEDKPKLMIVKSVRVPNGNLKYIDVLTDKEIARVIERPTTIDDGTAAYEDVLFSDYKCRICGPIDKYLEAYDMIKPDYEAKDMKILIFMITGDYDFEKDHLNDLNQGAYQYRH